jgi:hypothetical protein
MVVCIHAITCCLHNHDVVQALPSFFVTELMRLIERIVSTLRRQYLSIYLLVNIH